MSDPPDPYAVESLSDPETLLDRDAVAVERVTRDLDAESYEARQGRYEEIDGAVQIGLTDGDGRVLLQDWNGTGEWAPPGGTVGPGEDWIAAACRSAERLTGVAVAVDGAVLVEDLRFEREDGGASFSAYGVSFVCSLAEPAPSFRDDPAVAPDSRFAGGETRLAWVSAVPDDVRGDHADHVELFLRYADAGDGD